MYGCLVGVLSLSGIEFFYVWVGLFAGVIVPGVRLIMDVASPGSVVLDSYRAWIMGGIGGRGGAGLSFG